MNPLPPFHQSEEKTSAQVFRGTMRNLDYRILLVSLVVLNLSVPCEGRPLRKRTVSEVQLMHDLGQHQQVQERRDWLQTRLRGIHTAAVMAGRDGGGEAAGRRRRRLRAEELPELSGLTSEEIQQALKVLEKILKTQQA